jgi:hypothetical protein
MRAMLATALLWFVLFVVIQEDVLLFAIFFGSPARSD